MYKDERNARWDTRHETYKLHRNTFDVVIYQNRIIIKTLPVTCIVCTQIKLLHYSRTTDTESHAQCLVVPLVFSARILLNREVTQVALRVSSIYPLTE